MSTVICDRPAPEQRRNALQRLQPYLVETEIPSDVPTRYYGHGLNFGDRPRLLTARQVADVLGVSPKTVFKWAAAGLLPSVRLGERALRFDPRAVEQFIVRGQRGEVD